MTMSIICQDILIFPSPHLSATDLKYRGTGYIEVTTVTLVGILLLS